MDESAAGRTSSLPRATPVAAISAGDAAFEQLVDWLPQLIWTANARGECDFVNRQWLRYTGRSVQDVLGDRWVECVHPDCVSGLLAAWTRAVRDEKDFQHEFRLRRYDGEYRWFLTTAAAWRDPAGVVEKWFGSNTDVTESRDVRESLRAEKERLATAAATAPGVIHSFRIHPDGRTSFPYAAPSIETLYGVPTAELEHDARPALACTHPADVERINASVRDSRDHLTPWHEEFRIINRRTGRQIWIETHSRPVREADGSTTWHGVITDVTRRKEMEEELRRERDRLRRITNAVPEIIWVLKRHPDGQFTYEYISDAAEDLLGVPLDELARDATTWARRVHPDDLPAINAEFERSMRERRSYGFTYRLIHPTRGELWLEGRASPPDSPEPGALRWHGYITEVTERRRIEDALRESERRFAIAFRSSAVGNVLVRTEDEMIVEANDAFLRMLGHERTAVIGKPVQVLDSVLPTDTVSALKRAIHSQDALNSHELSFTRRDGDVRHGVLSVTAVTISEAPYGLMILTDITEQKEAQKAALEYRERLLAALEAGGMSTWIWAPERRELWWDDAAPRLWGRTRAELTRGSIDELREFIHAEDRREVSRALHAFVSEGANLRVDFRSQRPDGELQWLSLRAHAPEHRRQAHELTGVCVDITQRKLAEESQLNSQKMEALGTLAGGIAHDFNNVLLAISGNARLALAETAPEHAAYASLREIRRAAERATDLVRHILTFSRRQEVRREFIAVRPIVEEALGLLRPAVPAMIRIETRFDADVPPVEASATQLHQVIVNLVTNAAQAIGSRTGHISIAIERAQVGVTDAATVRDLKPGEYVRLAVSDDGVGMDRNTLARVFDPFFTTKAPGQGTGLGLPVVHGIVRNHGGAITVTSEPAVGSTFTVYLPASRGATTAQPQTHAVTAHAAGQHVLYIDDDEAVALLGARLLTRHGYRVTSFTDPQAALSRFRAQPDAFHVVVTDLSMPTLSGFDVTREVLSLRPEIPVLMTSGYVRPEDQAAAREAGVRELLLKPNTIDELGEVLDKLFSQLE